VGVDLSGGVFRSDSRRISGIRVLGWLRVGDLGDGDACVKFLEPCEWVGGEEEREH
jgi:hypothetical protein